MGLDNPLHLVFLVVVLLLVFGAKRLPEIGRSLGGGMREFKDSLTGESNPTTLAQSTQQTSQAPVQVPVAQPVAQPQAPIQVPVAQPQQPTPPQAAPPEHQG